MTRFEKMWHACVEKRRKTKGKCEEWECIGVGWCEDCLKAGERRDDDSLRVRKA